MSAWRIIGARTCRSIAANGISTSSASTIIVMTPSPSKASRRAGLDFHTESSAKNWATAYDFAAVRDGYVKRQEVPVERAQPMQCFVLNFRRPQFQDRRVRQAFNLAFDFEWANKNLFFGQYARVGSYFEGTELAAPKELPQGRELEILNEVKDQVPPEVFTTVHANPVNASPDDFRNNLRKAVALLKEAGYEIKGGKLVNAKTGEPLKVEFLLVSPLFERIVQPMHRQSPAARYSGEPPHGG